MYKWVDEKGVTHYSNAPHELPNAGVEETGEVKSEKPVEKVKDGNNKLQDDKTTAEKVSFFHDTVSEINGRVIKFLSGSMWLMESEITALP